MVQQTSAEQFAVLRGELLKPGSAPREVELDPNLPRDQLLETGARALQKQPLIAFQECSLLG